MKRVIKFVIPILVTLVVASCCSSNKQAKYVFYFIGDGMGFSHIAVTEGYKSILNGEKKSEPLLFTQFPVMGMATSYSASNIITCSSAAGTALSTGFKTNNGMLGVTPDSSSLEAISYKIHKAGYKVGIMSSVTIDHATPGAFYANSVKRSDYYGIAKQLCESNFEFFGGGGYQGATQSINKKFPLDSITTAAGYNIAYGLEDFNNLKSTSEKLVLFQPQPRTDNILSPVLERNDSSLTLPQVVEAAVEFLNSKDGFFIMAEGGQIDWSAHSNDVAGTIMEVLDFDAAIEVAYKFYQQHPEETLIVVTADHETGGISLGRNKGYVSHFDKVKEYIDGVQKKNSDVSVDNYMEQMPVDSLSKASLIGWTTTSHTGGAVPVFAIGAGSEQFAGRQDNTDIPKKICKAMGVEF